MDGRSRGRGCVYARMDATMDGKRAGPVGQGARRMGKGKAPRRATRAAAIDAGDGKRCDASDGERYQSRRRSRRRCRWMGDGRMRGRKEQPVSVGGQRAGTCTQRLEGEQTAMQPVIQAGRQTASHDSHRWATRWACRWTADGQRQAMARRRQKRGYKGHADTQTHLAATALEAAALEATAVESARLAAQDAADAADEADAADTVRVKIIASWRVGERAASGSVEASVRSGRLRIHKQADLNGGCDHGCGHCPAHGPIDGRTRRRRVGRRRPPQAAGHRRCVAAGRTDLRVEGLVQLATLLDQSPSPAVVNSAFVKLFDYWRSCTGNAMRPILALVIRKCARHAESIVAGRDEVVRRILAVLDSNDPCARSLTLLVVGHLAPVFRDKPDAQYTVYRELKSKSASELAAATYAVDRLWPVRRSQSSLQSLDTIVAAIRLAEQLDDQGHLALRLSNVLRNSDHEYTIAVKAFHSCTMLLNRSKSDNSADAAVRSVSLQKTLASLAQKFPAFLPRVIAQSLSMLRTSLHTTAAPPSATMEDAHLHNDKQIDGIYAQSIGAIDSLLGIAHTHPHFFQPLDVVSVADLLLGWTGQKDQHDRHSQQPPHDGLVRMQAKTSRLLSRLAAHPFLLIDAVRKHGLADRIAAFYAGIASLIRLTLQASIVLDVAKTALAAVRIEPECLEQAQANIHWSLDRIFRKLAVLDTSADQDAFSRLVYAYWCMCQTQMQGVCIESLKALLTNHKAVFVIGKIWSQSTDPDSDLSFVPDLLARFIDSDLDVFEPRQMMPLLQTMLCTAGVSNAAQIATIEIKLSSAVQAWLSVPGGCWWIFELVKEQLVSGIVVPSSSLFDLMLPMIDAPNVVAWLTATKYMGQASISLSQCRSRLGQFAAELQKAVTALESAASQLRLCSSLGMPRPFQLAFIGLLIALLAIMRRIDVRPSMAMYSARDLRRLAERFRQLPHHHYGIDEESEAVLA
ncbi:hypothetical protein BC831DRAFT_218130 [Entophlyctis helioformis]|nr:hypothetical protein BC831DRAFT_218130 [Entophlyctis helioformis]